MYILVLPKFDGACVTRVYMSCFSAEYRLMPLAFQLVIYAY